MVKQQDISGIRGKIKLKCPIHECLYKHSFTETDETLKNRLQTAYTREKFLRLHHDGGHRPVGSQG